jgi:hypothetical protein
MWYLLFKYIKWEITIGAILIFIGLYALYRKLKGHKGTWSESYFYDPKMSTYRPIDGSSSGKQESKGERECRRVLESIFHRKFPNKRPDFMKNPLTGRNLELDCYNEDLKIACEYNGRQHYEFLKHFHGTVEDFYKQKRNDQKTRENCIKNGIFLIEVPYTVKVPDIERFIVNKLSQSGLV